MKEAELEAKIKMLVEKALKEKLTGAGILDNNASFTGYNPIEKIRGALFFWVAVPFNGKKIYCQLRCPNATQIEQCGDISNILPDAEDGKKPDYDKTIKIRNYQEALCRIVFNKPTFDHISELVGKNDFVISEKKDRLETVKKQYGENKGGMDEAEKREIESRIETLSLEIGFILPDDTMAFIAAWAMGNDVSDIKKINKDVFLRAAVLAKTHQKAPSDYISGVFTDFNKVEIDAYAVSVYNEFLKDRQIAEGSKPGASSGILPKRAK
jgi:hypothetical protein